jgi:hypothetical protein
MQPPWSGCQAQPFQQAVGGHKAVSRQGVIVLLQHVTTLHGVVTCRSQESTMVRGLAPCLLASSSFARLPCPLAGGPHHS